MKSDIPLPEWGDAKSLYSMFGIRVPMVYKYLRLGLIKSAVIKADGDSKKRGKRLIDLNSVRKLLASQAGFTYSPDGSPGGPGCKGKKHKKHRAEKAAA
jgi:hypothetical protein